MHALYYKKKKFVFCNVFDDIALSFTQTSSLWYGFNEKFFWTIRAVSLMIGYNDIITSTLLLYLQFCPIIINRTQWFNIHTYIHTGRQAGRQAEIIGFSFWCSNKFHKKTLLLSPPNKCRHHRHDIGTTYSQKDLLIPPENTSKGTTETVLLL